MSRELIGSTITLTFNREAEVALDLPAPISVHIVLLFMAQPFRETGPSSPLINIYDHCMPLTYQPNVAGVVNYLVNCMEQGDCSVWVYSNHRPGR